MSFINNLFGGGRSSKAPVDQTESILRKHLDRDFRVFPMAEAPSNSEQILDIGKRNGVTYPEEFVTHVCGQFPGIYVEAKEEVWPRPKLLDVGPFWTFLYALHTFTSSPESNDWMRLDFVAQQFQANTGLVAAPVLQIVGDANVFCVGVDGQLMRYDHETNQLDSVQLGFWELFEREVSELKNRKMQKVSGT